MAIVTEEDVYSGSFSTAFPAGLRVLVVDNDLNCLSCLVRLLQDCHYRVTTCRGGADALSLLRSETKFDLVISDIYMPDIDGFKLLEIIQLEMDIPVIMMSKDASRDVVMKAIFMGACDYLVKPLRKEEISVIWQHVVRKNSKAFMRRPEINLSSHDYRNDNSNNKSITGEENCGSSSSHVRSGDQDERSKKNIVSMKKPRMIWTHELHDQFVAAVKSIGLKGAVPKKILALMKVPYLTRENVASHLQKYRIYLRREKENVGKKVCNMSSVQTMGSDTTASLQVVAYNPPVTNQLHSQSSVVSQVEMDEAHRLSAAAAGRTENVGKKVCNISSAQTQNVMHPYMMAYNPPPVTNQLYSQSSVVSQREMDESHRLIAAAAGCGSGGGGCINGVPITYYNQSLCYGLQTPPPPQTSVIHEEQQEILLSMEREQGLNDNDETIHFSFPISSVIVDVGQSNNNQQQQQQQQFGGCNLFSCYDRCSLDGTDQNASFATVGNNSYSEYTFPCYDSVFQPQHYNNIQEGLVGN